MLITYNPDDYVSEVTSHTCAFHEAHPGKPYAGCCCWSNYSMRRATEEERTANRQRRISDEEHEAILDRSLREHGGIFAKMAEM